jgi:hypothetical protein
MNKIYKSRSIFYKRWKGIFSRIGRHKNYKNIGISDDWRLFDNFYNDMYESFCEHINKYGLKSTSLERLDRFGNYCKENCIWATPEVQANNRSNGSYLTYNGELKSISQWSRILGISRQAMSKRMQNGWSIDKIFSTKKQKGSRFLLEELLKDILRGKFGTKNRAELISRVQEILDF